ncbi:MAG TPA: alkaline phosphatase family protein, partial [Planctomycetota bacterium]|nr:alkaline phosphatase family protein [Planctomycetota bacterium]
MEPVLWIDAVGLAPRLLSSETPHLAALAARGASAPMSTVLPAVTLSAQATLLTGALPRDHGIVGNGWYWRDLGEVLLWRQPSACVRGPKVYDRARALDPRFTCAKLFWWWNMGARVEWSLTPRPHYPADGRKIPAVYGWPSAYPRALEAELGPFPFFDFWGPKAGLASSRWLADAALRTLREQRPTLTMVYLPHLDYAHQRLGPDAPESRRAVRELDELVGELVAGADAVGAETVVVSEY